MNHLNYVIIGNSAAGIGAVEAIRKNDRQGKIIIISHEEYHTYSRPLISYLLLGKTTQEKMKYRDDQFYNDNNCQLLLSKTVVTINPDVKTIILDDGQCIRYDKLLVATGSSPFIPSVAGLDTVKNKFTFFCLNDAKALESVINEKSKVLIIGAGLIGLKCAEGISKKIKSTCVDSSPYILSSILDDDGSQIIKKHIENHSITFYLKTSVKTFKENKAFLSDGTIIEFDILVLAVGVRPNTDLIEHIGGSVGRGIRVNAKQATSIPDIYAAGDCTESVDAATGETKVMALLPNAYMQGECAGLNMSGFDHSFEKAIPMNAVGFFGLHIITAGSYTGNVYFERNGQNYKKLYYGNNKLNGYILIGNIEKAGIYTSLIREKTPLDTLDFDLICKTPGLMAFSKDVRAEKLGGEQREFMCE